MLPGVHFDEIGHRAVDNSIIQVSERASQDEGLKRHGSKRCSWLAGEQQHSGNRDQNHCRESDEQNVAPSAGSIGEHAERDARVLGMNDVEQPWDHSDRIEGGDMGLNHDFGDAIQDGDRRSDKKRKQLSIEWHRHKPRTVSGIPNCFRHPAYISSSVRTFRRPRF